MLESISQRLRVAVYSLIIAIAVILILVVNIPDRWDNFFLNLSTELLGAVLIVIIINIIFKLAQEKKINDQFRRAEIKEFFTDYVNFKELESIEIIGHTGEQILQYIFDYLTVLFKDDAELPEVIKGVKIRILLKSPDHETGKRAKSVSAIIEKIKEWQNRGYKNIQFHFYQNLPVFRSIICCRRNSPNVNRIAFLSFYYFPEITSQSKHYPDTIVVDEDKVKRHHLIEINKSWFENYWGKTQEDYSVTHTIIFDFDDTIVNSHSVQVEAWVNIINEIKLRPEIHASNFKPQIREILYDKKENLVDHNANDLRNAVTSIFFLKQKAELIYDEIFQHIETNLKDEIHRKRFEGRLNNMNSRQVKVFDGFTDVIKLMYPRYHFIIVSATEEDLIREYLNEVGLLKYFRYVFGKKEPTFDWQKIERKSQILIKIVNILGIPINRLVYIGDNNNDYTASKDVGVDFIEARLFETELIRSIGRNSLIFDGSAEYQLSNWQNFQSIIAQIEKQKLRHM